MRKISTARSSRRAPGLKDSDYDHEIALVDHAAEAVNSQQPSPGISAQTDKTDHALAPADTVNTEQTLSKSNTAAPTGPTAQAGPSSPQADNPDARSTASASGASTKSKNSKGSLHKYLERRGSNRRTDVPRVEVERENQDPPPPKACFSLCLLRSFRV